MNPLDISYLFFHNLPLAIKNCFLIYIQGKLQHCYLYLFTYVTFPVMVMDLSLCKGSVAAGHPICLSTLRKLTLMIDLLCSEPNIGSILTSH